MKELRSRSQNKHGGLIAFLIHEEQVSETFLLSAILALSGGFQDAYTYAIRGHVFANAQTGNIVLMSTHFMVGEWTAGFHYLLSLLAFALGVFFAEKIENRYKKARKLHWRQGVLLAEIIILFATGWISSDMNTLANMLVSFSCAMQVQTFRKVHGNPYASTMCIGNLRNGTAALSSFLRNRKQGENAKKQRDLRNMLCYYGVILFFAIGAGIGGNISGTLGIHAIWISAILLLFAFVLMMINRKEKSERPE